MTRKSAPAAEAGALDPAGLFARLAGRRGLILAVSGGPDSTALMLLVSNWRERPPVLVVSVDHGLRPEAADEARLVGRNADRLGLPWRIMNVAEPRRSGNLQDWARRARYACLTQATREAGFDAIVTAHHQDDQAETFLLRLARGSGAYGLTAMREEEPLGPVTLLRPLLGVSRAMLQAIVAESGLAFAVDPSNSDLRFDRVRMRALMPLLAEHDVDATRLAETARRLGRAAEALDHYAGKFLQQHFAADPFGVVSGSLEKFAELPEEVALRALARILKVVGGAEYTPPLAGIEALRDAMIACAGEDLKRTLSGVVVSLTGQTLTAEREWGRNGIAEAAAPAGATLLWDGRFRVEVPRLAGALQIGALGRSPRRLSARAAASSALRTLPGLFQDGTLVAIPSALAHAEMGDTIDILPVECIVGQRLGLGRDDRRAPQ